MTSVADTKRGRPRDPQIDARVLEATRDLLATAGFEATTIQAVARKSEVRPNAIYRRWKGRTELIEEAIFPGFEELTFVPTGSLRDDLASFTELYRSVIAKPEVLAAAPALMLRRKGESPVPEESRGWDSARPFFRRILAAASEKEIDRSLDPDAIFDLFVGAVLHRLQLLALGLRVGSSDETVDLVCRALRP